MSLNLPSHNGVCAAALQILHMQMLRRHKLSRKHSVMFQNVQSGAREINDSVVKRNGCPLVDLGTVPGTHTAAHHCV